MEIVPILSTIILVGTIATTILAVAAYALYKVRERKAKKAKAAAAAAAASGGESAPAPAAPAEEPKPEPHVLVSPAPQAQLPPAQGFSAQGHPGTAAGPQPALAPPNPFGAASAPALPPMSPSQPASPSGDSVPRRAPQPPPQVASNMYVALTPTLPPQGPVVELAGYSAQSAQSMPYPGPAPTPWNGGAPYALPPHAAGHARNPQLTPPYGRLPYGSSYQEPPMDVRPGRAPSSAPSSDAMFWEYTDAGFVPVRPDQQNTPRPEPRKPDRDDDDLAWL